MNNIDALLKTFESKIVAVKTEKEAEALKQEFMGRGGEIGRLMTLLKNTSSTEERKNLGETINQFKNFISQQLDSKMEQIRKATTDAAAAKEAGFDVTANKPNTDFPGNLHFYTKIYEEITNIFISLGFEVFDGPEVENEFYNFTALNVGPDHPARDMQDTFWTKEPNKLLRTHTSNVQIRAMLEKGAPLAGISIGRVFRHEALDATHEVSFSQCEGLFIDKNIGLSHLLGISKKFLQEFFKTKDIEIRIRPGFFPFVVPGIEIDMRCVFCKNGCNICKKTTWIEVFPGGLVHPFVLKSGKIDPEKYSGFAFGMGVDRLAMLRHQIHDIRLFKSGDARFINRF